MEILKDDYRVQACPRDGNCVLHAIASHIETNNIWVLKSIRTVIRDYLFFHENNSKLIINGTSLENECKDRNITKEEYFEKIMTSSFYLGIFEMGILTHMNIEDLKLINVQENSNVYRMMKEIIGRSFVIFEIESEKLSLLSIQPNIDMEKKPITLIHQYIGGENEHTIEHYDSTHLHKESDHNMLKEKIKLVLLENEILNKKTRNELILTEMKKIVSILDDMFCRLNMNSTS